MSAHVMSEMSKRDLKEKKDVMCHVLAKPSAAKVIR